LEGPVADAFAVLGYQTAALSNFHLAPPRLPSMATIQPPILMWLALTRYPSWPQYSRGATGSLFLCYASHSSALWRRVDTTKARCVGIAAS
jgi:hypothetical protein